MLPVKNLSKYSVIWLGLFSVIEQLFSNFSNNHKQLWALHFNLSWLWQKSLNWKNNTVWKVSVFGVFVVRIFLNSNWIRRDTKYLSVSVRIRENTDQKTPNTDTFHAVQGITLLAKIFANLRISCKISNRFQQNQMQH